MKKPIFIIEHLEKRVWKWCLLEYAEISKIVGKENLWFSNVKRNKRLGEFGRVFKESVGKMQLDNVCVLDPDADEVLTPEEAKKFSYFVFGGILGDNPPRKRTKRELTPLLPSAVKRNIGEKQMPTDNAVYVVQEIVNGKALGELRFRDNIEITINEVESVILPFRYVLVGGKPLIGGELVNYLKRKRGI